VRSFKLDRASARGDADVTHEALLWLLVLMLVVVPALAVVYWIVG
jgi:hypothetical protein